MQVFVHRTNVGDGKVGEGDYFAPGTKEASKDTVAGLCAFRHTTRSCALLAIGREVYHLVSRFTLEHTC